MDQINHISPGTFISDDGQREIIFSHQGVITKINGETVEDINYSGQFYPDNNLFFSDQALIYFFLPSNNRIAVGVINDLAVIERFIDSEIKYSRV